MSEKDFNAIMDRLDKIEHLSEISAKTILDVNEASVFTGYKVSHIYRLTSTHQIPHFKKNRKVLFKKADLEDWLCENRVMTQNEISQAADTYISTKKMK